MVKNGSEITNRRLREGIDEAKGVSLGFRKRQKEEVSGVFWWAPGGRS